MNDTTLSWKRSVILCHDRVFKNFYVMIAVCYLLCHRSHDISYIKDRMSDIPALILNVFSVKTEEELSAVKSALTLTPLTRAFKV